MNTKNTKKTSGTSSKAIPSKQKPTAVAKSSRVSLETSENTLVYEPKKGEEYMSSTMREHFGKVLTELKKEIMRGADSTIAHMKEEANNHADLNDRATQEEEFRLELRTRDRERKLLKKIEEALQLIEDGDYGYCDSCGLEIGSKRLNARPTATLCIDCKETEEKKEKQMAGD